MTSGSCCLVIPRTGRTQYLTSGMERLETEGRLTQSTRFLSERPRLAIAGCRMRSSTQSGKAAASWITLVRSRHFGLTYLPRWYLADAPDLRQNHFTRESTRRVSRVSKFISILLLLDLGLTLPNQFTTHTLYAMDRRTPYTLSVLAPSTDGADESRTQVQARLREFVLEFQLDNAFIYRYDHKLELGQG